MFSTKNISPNSVSPVHENEFSHLKAFDSLLIQLSYGAAHFIIYYYFLGLSSPTSYNQITENWQSSGILVLLLYYLNLTSLTNNLWQWGAIFLTLKYCPNYVSLPLFIVSFVESRYLVSYQPSKGFKQNISDPSKTPVMNNPSMDYASDADSDITLGSPCFETSKVSEIPIPDSTPKVVQVIKVQVLERQRWYRWNGWTNEMFDTKDPSPFSILGPNPLSFPDMTPQALVLPRSNAPAIHPEYPIQTISHWLWAPLNNPDLLEASVDPQFEIEDDWTHYKSGWKDPKKELDSGSVVRSRIWACNLIKVEFEDYHFEVDDAKLSIKLDPSKLHH